MTGSHITRYVSCFTSTRAYAFPAHLRCFGFTIGELSCHPYTVVGMTSLVMHLWDKENYLLCKKSAVFSSTVSVVISVMTHGVPDPGVCLSNNVDKGLSEGENKSMR